MAIIKDIEKARSLSPKWREDLTTGNISIDRQHRNLLGRIDDLVKACIDAVHSTQLLGQSVLLTNRTTTEYGLSRLVDLCRPREKIRP
jgi:hypothetical protein